MTGGRFFWKVFRGMVAVIAITALVVYYSAVPRFDDHLLKDTERRVARETQLAGAIAALAWSESEGRFDTLPLEGLAHELPESRITMIRPDGTVLFDSLEDPAVMDNHANRPEVLEPGSPATRFSRTLEREMTYFALPVEVDGQLRATVRVAVSRADRSQRATELRDAIRNGALIAGLVALALALIFARRITSPLREIADLVSEVGKGPPTRRLLVAGNDEISQLAKAVNTMADELQDKIERIERDRSEREAILSAMANGLLAVDVQQRILFVNQPARDLLGMPDGAVQGRPVWELNRNVELADLLAYCSEGDEPLSAETILGTIDGERTVEISAVPLIGSEGGRRGCVLVLTDATELRRLEGVRRDFVSNVSHELKTPLTAMAGYLEAVLENSEMSEAKRDDFLGKAQRNTARLTAIVTDLLSLARLESADHELILEPLRASDLAEEAMQEVEDLAASRNITIDLEVAEESLAVAGDSQILVLALTNLLSNAIKYSRPGESVRLRISRRDALVQLEVIDRGPGIPRAEQERIFERFYRVDKARSRQLGGTGLGLAIVRHVMAAHGGRVELDSAPGQGSTFRLLIPSAA